MNKKRIITDRSGFTIIDVVLSIAILGILASIATMRFQHLSYKTRLTEAPTNADAIMIAENAYHADTDQFKKIDDFAPRDHIDRQAVPWVGNEGFDTIGFRPDGYVRCKYQVQTHQIGLDINKAVLVQIQCNVDGTGSYALYQKWQHSRLQWGNWERWNSPPGVY